MVNSLVQLLDISFPIRVSVMFSEEVCMVLHRKIDIKL